MFYKYDNNCFIWRIFGHDFNNKEDETKMFQHIWLHVASEGKGFTQDFFSTKF